VPNESLTLVKNDQWDPATDPARHQYADKWIFKFNEDQAKVDQIMLSDNTESQTSHVERARLEQLRPGEHRAR
jgi:peptide/nickel transport system substrate-binding protein